MAPDWSFISGVHVVDAVAQGAEQAGLRVHKGQGADAGHGVPNPSAQLVGAVGAALGGPGGHLLALLIPKDGQFHFLAFQVLEYGLDLLNGADLGVVDVGDDVPLLEPAGPGGRGQSLVGGDVGQPHHQDALGKELNAHRPAQGDHRAGGAVLGFRCLGTWDQRHRHNHGGGQQEQGAKEPYRHARPMAFVGVLQEITSLFLKT